MKKLTYIFLTLVFACTLGAQTTRYAHIDSLAVTTTAIDSAFVVDWETATVFFDGCDGNIKFSVSNADTSGWAAKPYMLLREFDAMSIIKSKELGVPGLNRLQYRSVSGSGTMYIVGTKVQ